MNRQPSWIDNHMFEAALIVAALGLLVGFIVGSVY